MTDDDIKALRELSRFAFLPWNKPEKPTLGHGYILGAETDFGHTHVAVEDRRMAALIVAAVNALPSLLSRLEEAATRENALVKAGRECRDALANRRTGSVPGWAMDAWDAVDPPKQRTGKDGG